MGFDPKPAGRGYGIDRSAAPPPCFITAAVDLSMVTAAQRDGEFVTDLFAERPALGEAEVMGIAGYASADQAGLLRHVFEMSPVTDPPWLRKREHAFVDPLFFAHRCLSRRPPLR